ncbi:hypothetical protein [Desulfofalx alkaliphila]|uniref:CHASE3 domain-containing protein n=1 Tax=Desulfofalx alkaliphila TaxID=105483 RepID=UPI0004E12D95|nr:hypothetical protein [Desulfofalx alkaliphila]
MKLRIATKIAAGYLVLTLMILILGVHGYNNSKATEYQMQQVDILNDRVDVEKAIQLETYAIMSSLRGFTATGEESYKEECIDRLNKTFELVEELQSIAADGNREAVENLKNLIIKYQQQVVGHTLPAIEQRYNA